VKTFRVLYHMVRADFLERVRRYSFLLSLCFSIYLGYAVYSGQVRLQLGNYRGVSNSAWLGSVITLLATTFLTLVGFYIVKNTIQRDRETRVGQILATTPMSKAFYTISKTLSNFAVLATMVLILVLAAIVIQLIHGDDGHISLFALCAPVLVFALCAVTVTAALAVFFESVPALSGGVGNILYFFLWIFLVSMSAAAMVNGQSMTVYHRLADFTGLVSVMGQMEARLHAIDPLYKGGSSFGIGDLNATNKVFLWTGLQWNAIILLSRAMWVGIAGLIALLASIFFDRFDPSRARTNLSRKKSATVESQPQKQVVGNLRPSIVSRLIAARPSIRMKNSFLVLVTAEFRLQIRGRSWWWYAGAAALFFSCLFSPIDSSRSGVILVAWIWPILLWSEMGTREARFSTTSLIYSARSAFPGQLLASWAAGFLVALLTGGGLGLRLLALGDFLGLGAWLAGALFIPSLALALGVFTGGRRAFEAVYTAWWYIGPLHHAPGIDFMATTPASSNPLGYIVASALLVATAYVWRKTRLAYA
jgi:hypothetical protein